jgi:hypothetical protein
MLYEFYKEDGLEAYLSNKVLPDEKLAAAAARGEVIKDTRLRDFLRAPQPSSLTAKRLDTPLESAHSRGAARLSPSPASMALRQGGESHA